MRTGRRCCLQLFMSLPTQAEESFLLLCGKASENGAALLFAVICVPPCAGRGEFYGGGEVK